MKKNLKPPNKSEQWSSMGMLFCSNVKPSTERVYLDFSFKYTKLQRHWAQETLMNHSCFGALERVGGMIFIYFFFTMF